MPRGSRIVDVRNTVQDVADFYISHGGESRKLAEGYVAQYGIVRQFWPSTMGESDPIVMTSATELSYAAGPGSIEAICTYDSRTSRLILSDYNAETQENGFRYVNVIAPAPRGAGNYLFKFDIVSGDLTTDFTEGAWIDVFSLGTLGEFKASLPVSGTAQGTFSIARDNGSGGPASGSIVSKTINFINESLNTNILMTTQPWNLSNTEVNEVAEVFVLTVPDNWWSESNQAYTDGAFITGEYGFPKGQARAEKYVETWTPQITVQVDVVSGAVEGDATGVALSTDVRRIWYIKSDQPEEIQNATIDVTITDGPDSTTKRITMYSEWAVETTDPGSEIDPEFTRADVVRSISTDLFNPFALAGFEVLSTGIVNAYNHDTNPVVNFPQNWHSQAPTPADPGNYECRMTLDTGDSPTGTLDMWLNCNTKHFWELTIIESEFTVPPEQTIAKNSYLTFEIREVGRPETVQSKTLRLSCRATKDFG